VTICDGPEHCISQIPSGSSIMIGGFGLCGIPEKSLAALAKYPQIKNLTTISNDIA
jgi:acyl CoA:acetate/3-ketoacid CoA transferase alpha subunit